MKRPTIKSPCVADTYHRDGERIAEFSFPNGSGGLINLSQRDGQQPTLHVYRQDPDVRVIVSSPKDSWSGPAINAIAAMEALKKIAEYPDRATLEQDAGTMLRAMAQEALGYLDPA